MSKVLSDLSSERPEVLNVAKSSVLCMTFSDITEAALVADHATSARIMSIVALDNRTAAKGVNNTKFGRQNTKWEGGTTSTGWTQQLSPVLSSLQVSTFPAGIAGI